MSKSLNYNKDIVKHYVRHNGWKEAFRVIKNYIEREIQSQRRQVSCKYFTFCAAQAIDVFMFELEKFIYRDSSTERLKNVYFCENDSESFSLIAKMIGSEGQGFYGDFKDIVLQDLNEIITVNSDPFDEPSTEDQREILRLKDLKKNMIGVFPFDVINLDFYGNFFPNYQHRYSDYCQTYKEVLKLQKMENDFNCQRFLMFLTVYTPLSDRFINAEALQQLVLCLTQNMGYERFRNAFREKYEIQDPTELELHLKFIIGFLKQIIFKESYKLGWQPQIKNIYCYDRFKPGSGESYKISTFIVEYKRNENLVQEDLTDTIPIDVQENYLTQLEEIITNKPHNIPNEEDISDDVRVDLEKIVAYRNEFLKKIGIYDETIFS